MLDRYGNRVLVGWALHELIWIEAALSLPSRALRAAAYEDIADLSGRGVLAVRDKANHMAALFRLASEAEQTARRILVAERSVRRAPVTLPSDLRQPTMAQKMGARA